MCTFSQIDNIHTINNVICVHFSRIYNIHTINNVTCMCTVSHIYNIKVKGKVFYGQEPPSGESTTECGVKYQLLTVMY